MKARTPLTLAGLRRQLAPWQARWERQARRIDALSLRERVILFLCIAAVLAALFDTLVLTPLSARGKQRADLQASQRSELIQLREQFVAAGQAGSGGPGQQLRGQIDIAQSERNRLDLALRAATSAGSAGAGPASDGLPAVLQRLLAQHPGLSLDRVALLDDVPVAAPKLAQVSMAPKAAPGPAGAASAPAALALRWQGVELQVQGPYRDAQRYLQSLEQSLPGLRWGEMRLTSAGVGEAPRLQVQLFLLRVQP
jgi:MSHA biogenesis protein MshJ